MGRQPWVVYGVLKTSAAVSTGVPAWEVLVSLVVFTLLYGSLAVVEVKILTRYAKAGPPESVETSYTDDPGAGDPDRPLVFAY